MGKLQFLRFVGTVLLGFLLLVNFSFSVGVCNGFAKGGLDGIKQWINHINYEGRGTFREVSHVHLRFALGWLFIIALTLICFHVIRLCTGRIHALEAEGNPST